jgi:LPS sulfotransferase NodH
VLGTPSAPDQFTLRTRDEAVSQALAFAKRQQVRVFANADDEFVLLGTFRKEHAAPARSS